MVSTADNLAKFNIPELERYNDDFRQIAKNLQVLSAIQVCLQVLMSQVL